jgi:hypothetical protein
MRIIVTLLLVLIAHMAYAKNQPLKSWDENVFETAEPVTESYSPFEMLDQKNRYSEAEKSKHNFDVTEVGSDMTDTEPHSKASKVKSDPNILPKEGRYYNSAKLVVINKITASSKELNIRVGQSEYFGNIKIKVEKCWYNNDLYNPSHKILALVTKHIEEDDPKLIYHGWFISSNLPACNIEDSTYEIIARSCYDKAQSKR